MVDAAAVLFLVLLVVFEVRHYIWSGDSYYSGNALAEAALNILLLLALVIGLERVRAKSGSVVHDLGAQILSGIVLVMIVIELGITENPLFTGVPVGGPLVNLILLAYGLPAVLAGVLAYIIRDTRPKAYSNTAAAIALALVLAYLSLQIRRLYQGPDLAAGTTSDAEQYTYSAVWLAFGVVLLAAGIFFRSLPLRIASAAISKYSRRACLAGSGGPVSSTAARMWTSQRSRSPGPIANGACRIRSRGCPRSSS